MADLIQALNGLSDEQRALMAQMPVATPPPGIQSNFINPPSRTAMQTWVTTTFLVIAMVFYINRVYVKTMLMKTWTWDDGMFISTRKLRPRSVKCCPKRFVLTSASDLGSYCRKFDTVKSSRVISKLTWEDYDRGPVHCCITGYVYHLGVVSTTSLPTVLTHTPQEPQIASWVATSGTSVWLRCSTLNCHL